MVDNDILYSAKCMDGKIKVREQKGDQMKVYTAKDSARFNEWKIKSKRSNAQLNNKRNIDARSPEEQRSTQSASNGQRTKQFRADEQNSHEAVSPNGKQNQTSEENIQHQSGKRCSQTTLERFRLNSTNSS